MQSATFHSLDKHVYYFQYKKFKINATQKVILKLFQLKKWMKLLMEINVVMLLWKHHQINIRLCVFLIGRQCSYGSWCERVLKQ